MGNQKAFLSTGGFSQYLYVQDGETIVANGMSAKVVTRFNDSEFHSSLPPYSNTSSLYLKRSDQGSHDIEQMRYYIGRKAAIDFDWGHTHGHFKEGVVHVHVWLDGVRQPPERLMNNQEMKRFGNLIKKANPKAKFR